MSRTAPVTPESGFTLAEVLVALVIVSLTVASLLQTTGITAHGHRKRTDERQAARHVTQVLRSADSRLNALPPHNLARAQGDAAGLSYPCPEGDCRLEASAFAADARIVYVSGQLTSSVWPPKTETDIEPGAKLPRLEALIVEKAGGRTLGMITLSAEQAIDCQFDSISRDCREMVTP